MLSPLYLSLDVQPRLTCLTPGAISWSSPGHLLAPGAISWCRLALQGVITVPESCGSRLCGTERTATGSTPKAEGDFSNMRTRSATEPPGLEPSMRRSPGPMGTLRSLMCCFCSGVSSGCGALGIMRLLRLLNCSRRKELGSSPQGESNIRMLPKLLGLTPPSLAGSDKAILCLASSNLRLISTNLASLTVPNSLKRLGMGACWSLGARGCCLAFWRMVGDLRPPDDGSLMGAFWIGICLTGIGMAPSLLNTWMKILKKMGKKIGVLRN